MTNTSSLAISLFIPSMGGVDGVERVIANPSQGTHERRYDVEAIGRDLDGPFVDELSPELSHSRLSRIDLPLAPVIGATPSPVTYLRERRPRTLISFIDQVYTATLLAWRLSRVKTRLIVFDHNNPKPPIDEKNPERREDRLIYRAAK